jgi:hypothetical protein
LKSRYLTNEGARAQILFKLFISHGGLFIVKKKMESQGLEYLNMFLRQYILAIYSVVHMDQNIVEFSALVSSRTPMRMSPSESSFSMRPPFTPLSTVLRNEAYSYVSCIQKPLEMSLSRKNHTSIFADSVDTHASKETITACKTLL